MILAPLYLVFVFMSVLAWLIRFDATLLDLIFARDLGLVHEISVAAPTGLINRREMKAAATRDWIRTWMA